MDYLDFIKYIEDDIKCTRSWTVNDTTFNDDSLLEQRDTNNNKNNKQFMLYTYKSQLCFLDGDYKEAINFAHKAIPFFPFAGSLSNLAKNHFYIALSIFRGWESWTNKDQASFKIVLNNFFKQFQKWGKINGGNYKHIEYIIQAEWNRIEGNIPDAMEFYDQAIQSAHDFGFFRNEAIANELAGRFYKTMGRTKSASVYLQDAYQGYTSLRLLTKVKQLEADFPNFIYKKDRTLEKISSSKVVGVNRIIDPKTGERHCDLTTIIKASQSISESVSLEEILRRLIKLMTENSGAEKGFLIIKREGSFSIEVALEGQDKFSIQPEIITESHRLSMSVIRRTSQIKENVVLKDAYRDREGEFSSDEYIIKHKSKSILCLPIFLQGKLTGLLYFENQSKPNAFNMEHFDVLQILGSQATFVRNLLHSTIDLQSQTPLLNKKEKSSEPILLEPMTKRELEILSLVARGFTNQEIAQTLELTVGTIKIHNHNIFSKLGVKNRTKAVAHAKELKIIGS